MSPLPLGHRIDGEFVCMNCISGLDHREGGITSAGFSAVDERVGSGKECSRCERRMPYLATVRLLPDGWSSVDAPTQWTQEKIIRVEREEKTLIDKHALVYVDIGCQREVGICVTPHGKIEVWVHDDPYGNGDEPSKRWEYDPAQAGAIRESQAKES